MADEQKYQSSNITITFSTNAMGADVYVNVELDEEANNDATSFEFGADVYVKVYTNAGTIDSVTTGGTLSVALSDQIEEVEDDPLNFLKPTVLAQFGVKAKDNTASLSKYASNTPTYTHVAGTSLSLSLGSDNQTVTANALGVAMYKANYQTKYDQYKLSGVTKPVGWPDDTDYPVAVIFTGYNS